MTTQAVLRRPLKPHPYAISLPTTNLLPFFPTVAGYHLVPLNRYSIKMIFRQFPHDWNTLSRNSLLELIVSLSRKCWPPQAVPIVFHC
ncbi:unnamed protein product, partial [Haemonchus placei]|uniref:Uncharacterized protein n=1 Tax=Haemonchus placei TaxID=6290 RepID=A0A0N4VWX1_HAEPC